MDSILNIALCLLVRNGEILLLRRKKHPYKGLLALPGGKVEYGETPAQAAMREAKEETGLVCNKPQVLGCATETIYEYNSVSAHFVMFPVLLDSFTGETCHSEEGELCWISLEGIMDNSEVIPTDREMIRLFLFRPMEGGQPIVPHFRVLQDDGEYRLLGVE